MWTKIAAMIVCLALAACAGVAGRHADERAYQSVARLGGVEVRQYGALVAAETIAEGDEGDARGTGYRRLADYFSGANAAGTKIARTGPVAQAADAPGRWRIRVFLSTHDAVAALPQPNDPSVTLVPVPPETLAVLGFSGKANAEAVAKHTGELVAALEGSAWRPAGAPVAWFYDAGWVPRSRHTDVAIPVSPM